MRMWVGMWVGMLGLEANAAAMMRVVVRVCRFMSDGGVVAGDAHISSSLGMHAQLTHASKPTDSSVSSGCSCEESKRDRNHTALTHRRTTPSSHSAVCTAFGAIFVYFRIKIRWGRIPMHVLGQERKTITRIRRQRCRVGSCRRYRGIHPPRSCILFQTGADAEDERKRTPAAAYAGEHVHKSTSPTGTLRTGVRRRSRIAGSNDTGSIVGGGVAT